MTIEIRHLDRADSETWNDAVDRSPHASPFHQFEALELLADRGGCDLHPLVGYKGAEPVGLLPLFETTLGPFTAVYSPPPHLEVYYLGPALLNFEKLKQRKAERRHRRFVEACLDWVGSAVDPDYADVRVVDRYPDLRPFTWNDYDVEPAYTYVVDLTPGTETLFENLSRDARSNVRSADEARYDISEGGVDAVRDVVGRVADRHAAQDEEYRIDPAFAAALYETLPDGQVRPYVCRVDGDVVGGIVALDYGDTVYRWQGGTTPDVDVPVNDLLDWRIIADGVDRGRTRYDLVGANMPRLCGYKAKFDPDPVAYFKAVQRTPRMKAVSELYRRLPDAVRVVSE